MWPARGFFTEGNPYETDRPYKQRLEESFAPRGRAAVIADALGEYVVPFRPP